jgi:predicted lipoprotein
MKRKVALITAALLTVSLTGCGIVKVVPIGEEAQYTGKAVFDSSAQSGDDWSQVAEEITSNATDLTAAMDDENIGTGVAVTGTAKITEFNTDTPKYYLLIEPDGFDGSQEVKIQAGGVYSGTAIRDTQSVKVFADFTNQTEWSQYAKALNQEADAQVVSPLGLDESVAGKTVTFTGAAVVSGDTVTITPVALTIE